MKTRFTTVDIVASLSEIQSVLGMRVNQVYDIDSKTYLIKLASKDKKATILIESGARLHLTEYEWPKNQMPSGFTMKLRKHIDNRRLEFARQLGVDRIVDFQFGSGEAAYHVILELYDKGNIVLTDCKYEILNILRPRTEKEVVKFMVRNNYPVDSAKQQQDLQNSPESLTEVLLNATEGDSLRRVLNPHLIYGPAVIDHVLLSVGFNENAKIGSGFSISDDLSRLSTALNEAEEMLNNVKSETCKGYIIQKKEKKTGGMTEDSEIIVYQEFHPFLYNQHKHVLYEEFNSFNKAVDEFFSKLECQKIDLKQIRQEKEALKKLDNVKRDHEKRLEMLEKQQEEDKRKAQLIEINLELVRKAILSIQSAIASQMSWKEIWSLLQEAKAKQDPVASAIKGLKLEINHFTMLLSNPYVDDDDGANKPCLVDIDLDLTAYANAKRYYDMKRTAAVKEQKTVESSTKAYKSAEKKTKQALKDVAVISSIKKMRKVHWFEKFYWFVSAENYLAVGGRDQQQNELIVKRHLRPGDIYVHADLHGASSIVIKNPSGLPIPPKTLNEVGTMAMCFSAAWEAKVVTSAWWVHHDQVSKTAPSGEYLTTGSFMIRGKKNYLPPCHLIMGFGLLFKLAEESIAKHKGERTATTTTEVPDDTEEELEIPINDSDDGDNENTADVEDQDTNADSQAEENGDDQIAFPDTVIELEHVEGEKFRMRHRTVSKQASDLGSVEGDPFQSLSPIQTSTSDPFSKISTKKHKPSKPTPLQKPELLEKPQQLKRGQKNKLKKIKEKYKDQDESDRLAAIQLLNISSKPKDPKKLKRKNAKEAATKNVQNARSRPPPRDAASAVTETYRQTDGGQAATVPHETADEVPDEEKDAQLSAEDALVLDSLTGKPDPDDVLMYCIPMCAPYNSLTDFKYKVKLLPGTGKRGKATKTALTMFLQDKTAQPREKDLIKSLKDEDIARNLPGRVKLTAPNLQKVKK